LACPVGAEHRYSAEQLRHHYQHSLAAIRAWAAPVDDPSAPDLQR
jgi:hypothetical protein